MKMKINEHAKTSLIDRKLHLGFIAATVGLIIGSAFQQQSLNMIKTLGYARADLLRTATELSQLNELLTEAETGQRGYILTGNRAYLAPYDDAIKIIPQHLNNLEGKLHDRPENLAKLKRITQNSELKLQELALTINLKRKNQSGSALDIIKGNVGRITMDEIRKDLGELVESENGEARESEVRMERIRIYNSWLSYGGSAFAVVLLIAFTAIFFRNEKNRLEARRYLVELNEQLETQRHSLRKIILAQTDISSAEMSTELVMDLAIYHSMELTGAEAGIVEFLQGSELIYQRTSRSLDHLVGMRISATGTFSGLCIAEERTFICEDSEIDDRVDREACRRANLRSMIVLPLKHRNQVIGVLKNCSKEPNFFTKEHADTLALVSGALSSSLSQAKEFEARTMAMEQLQKTQVELTNSRDEARTATKAKSLFLANMSHELRTPLTGVLGMAGLLSDTTLTEVQRDYTTAIKSSGESLLRLVNDVLDFSKIEAGHLEFESVDFDLTSTLQDVTRSFRFQAAKKDLEIGLSIDKSAPPYLRGDPGRIRQILTNLIGNSIKFTASGSVSVDVQCRNVEENLLELRVEIRDTGIGMTPAQLKNLFKDFTQADASTTRQYGGTGLGLSICKRLVEKMNGQIGVVSELKQGSTFWFTIQVAVGNQVVKPKHLEIARSLAREGKPWSILVAEDSEFNQIIISENLKSMGLQPHIVANGKAAVEAIEAGPYDLILMDCQMPEMDGFEATAMIRASTGPRAKIPIVAMTANAMKEDQARCLAAGMDDYLTKPLVLPKVAEVLAKWLNRDATEERAAS